MSLIFLDFYVKYNRDHNFHVKEMWLLNYIVTCISHKMEYYNQKKIFFLQWNFINEWIGLKWLFLFYNCYILN